MLPCVKLSNEVQTRHARHLQVGDDQVVALFFQGRQPFDGAGHAIGLVTGLAEDVGHRLAGLGVVVDDQYATP